MLFSSREGQSGHTLVELMVVIVVLSVLIMLLLPAIQSARENGRRINCASNMKQVGLALRLYDDTFKQLPSRVGRRHGILTFILPQIERMNLFEQYHWDKNWDAPQNQQVVTTHVSMFRCPSAPGGWEPRYDWIGGSKRAATSDYTTPTGIYPGLVLSGLLPISQYADTVGRRPRLKADRLPGAMGMVRARLGTGRGVRVPPSLGRISDGESNTLLLIEDAGRPEHWVRGKMGPAKVTPGPNYPVLNGRVWGAGWADYRIAAPLHGFTADGLHVPGDCPINCTNNNEAYSFHIDGINAVFADGRVTFVHETTAIDVYAAMVTRAGKESPR